MNTIEQRLSGHWERFAQRFKLPRLAHEPIFNEIRGRYAEPHRTYHGMLHPVLLLDELQNLRQYKPEWFHNRRGFDFAVELAIWDHDLFYDVHRDDNEEHSAYAAMRHSSMLGFSSEVGGIAYAFVRATKHQVPPTELGEQIVVDIDLSPLAAPWPMFSLDSTKIRQESPLSDEEFRVRQGGFLRGLLNRPSIYSTEYYQEQLEAQARRNIERACAPVYKV